MLIVFWLWGPSFLAGLGARGLWWHLISPWACFIRTVSIGYGKAPDPTVCICTAAGIFALCAWLSTLLVDRPLARVRSKPAAKPAKARSRPRRQRTRLMDRLFFDVSAGPTRLEHYSFLAGQFLAGVGVIACWVLIAIYGRTYAEDACVAIGVLWMAYALMVPIMCTRFLVRQKIDRSLPILFTTSVTPRQIAWAHLIGVTRLALPVLICCAIARGSSDWHLRGETLTVVIGFAFVRVAMCWFALATSSVVALALSGYCKTHAAAMGATIALFLLSSCFGANVWTYAVLFTSDWQILPMSLMGITVNAVGLTIAWVFMCTWLRSWSQRV